MTLPTYPRSPKILLGGLAHLARLIDKIRLRHAGQIQDYNYLTIGFDKYLLDLLQIQGGEFERVVLEANRDEEVLAWIRGNGRSLRPEEVSQWNERILKGEPRDDAGRRRFQNRLADVAAKQGVPVEQLPAVTTWVEIIELDEGRL
jgi:hypothetical protein